MTTGSQLFVKDPVEARYLGGGLPEVEALLGIPLPPLPTPEFERGHEVFFVRFHPNLRTVLRRFLQDLLRRIESEGTGEGVGPAHREQLPYERELLRLLQAARASDRRMGLLNLFWLAHSRDVADCVADLEQKGQLSAEAKRLLPSLLASFYRRVGATARKAVEEAGREGTSVQQWSPEHERLLEALTEDGYAFVATSLEDLDLDLFVAANRRLRYSPRLFAEIEGVLMREVEARLRSGDGGLLSRVSRYLPGIPRAQMESLSSLRKMALHSQVMLYLLGDVWTTGQNLLGRPLVRDAAAQRSPAEVVGGFLDLVEGLKRFELLCHLGDRVRLGEGLFAAAELDERVRGGARVYEFGESTQVLNNAVNATVLFLDLRGFTQTSEGQVSERDLTRELYTVFDVFVPIVCRFGGTVDKVLGDGMMVTFGTTTIDPASALNAVRTALTCQEELQRLRDQGLTAFRMGVSVHYGRVYLARFFADRRSTQVTVIGRNVNLAGRLSSTSRRAIDEDEAAPEPPAERVSVDENGALTNEGIVLSRAALVQIAAHVRIDSIQRGEAQYMSYEDELLARRVLMRYAGEAKFKGVRASFPVFEVVHGQQV